jgi:hypothetical protein
MMAAQAFPPVVTGNISPYPTVERVAAAHHIVAGMLENTG